MMAAVQPFLSGAISKTVNMPKESTVEEIMQRLRAGLEAGPEGRGHLPRRLQAHPAAERLQEGQGRARPPTEPPGRRAAEPPPQPHAACRPPARRSRTSSTSPATRATSTSGLYEDGTPGRAVHHHGQGRLHGRRHDGRLRHGHQPVPPVRRAAGGAGQEVLPPAVRAQRHDHQPRHPLRQEHRGLHLPLAGPDVPGGLPQGPPARSRRVRAGGPKTAAPEAVRDDRPSETDSADQTSSTEARRSGGACCRGYYISGG